MKDLIDVRRGHLIGNGDVNAVGTDLELIVDEDGSRAGRIACGRIDDDDSVGSYGEWWDDEGNEEREQEQSR
jgi:hypothetical protein